MLNQELFAFRKSSRVVFSLLSVISDDHSDAEENGRNHTDANQKFFVQRICHFVNYT